MIDLQDIRAKFAAEEKEERHDVEPLMEAVLAQWDTLTARVWGRVEGFEQKWRIRPNSRSTASVLWSKLYPIEAITISEWWSDEKESEASVVQADCYDVDFEVGRIQRLSRFAAVHGGYWPPNVKATMTGGWTVEAARESADMAYIRSALLHQVVYLHDRLDDQKISVNSLSVQMGDGTGTTQFMRTVQHPIFSQAVHQHRRRRV